MKTSNIFLTMIVAVVVIAGIGYLTTKDSQAPLVTTSPTQNNTETELATSEVKLDKNPVAAAGASTLNKPADTAPVSVDTTPTPTLTAGTFTDYSAAAVANSEAEHIVLFFHATWCPSCRTLASDIQKNISNIPAGTEIYKVDYDTALELRKQYKITTQHTIVHIEKDGTFIKKSVGDRSLNQIISAL